MIMGLLITLSGAPPSSEVVSFCRPRDWVYSVLSTLPFGAITLISDVASTKGLTELFSAMLNLQRRQQAPAIKMDCLDLASSFHLHSSRRHHSIQMAKRY
jgi:hypothetical protein